MIVTVIGTTIGKWKNDELKELDLIKTDDNNKIINLDIKTFDKNNFIVTYATFFNLPILERFHLRDLKKFFEFIDWKVFKTLDEFEHDKESFWYNDAQALLNNLITKKK